MKPGLFTILVAPALLALAACSPAPEPPREPLTADPPLGTSSADEGAAQTELQRGIAFITNEKYKDAKSHLEQSMASHPSAEASYYLGLAAEKLGDRPGAEEAYKKAIALDGKLVEASANLGAFYLDDPPRPDDAIAVLKAGLEKNPGEGQLLRNLAYAYSLKGDVDSASKQYDTLLAKGEDADVRFAYGTLLFDQKKPERAVEQLKKALDGMKDDTATLVTVGRMLGSSKAYGDCVRAFDRAIKLKATDPEWFVRRGLCRHELKDEAAAQTDFQAATKVDPKFAAAHYYLALSFLADKKRQAATAELEKAKALGGDIGKTAKAKLDELSKAK